MRTIIIKLLFGNEDLLSKTVALLETRAKAVSQHVRNKFLRDSLALGEADLRTHKQVYAGRKAALEAAYNLELD